MCLPPLVRDSRSLFPIGPIIGRSRRRHNLHPSTRTCFHVWIIALGISTEIPIITLLLGLRGRLNILLRLLDDNRRNRIVWIVAVIVWIVWISPQPRIPSPSPTPSSPTASPVTASPMAASPTAPVVSLSGQGAY